MNLFGLNITWGKKGAATDIDTRPQFLPTSPQGPLTPWFQDYVLRKVSGEFYEALREGIPVFDSAIRRLISLNGTIRIIGDKPALVRELEDFALNVPVNDTQTGIHAFLECFANETFEQGFSLSEFIATPDMRDIAGLRVADSKNIVYRRNAEGRAEPWYRYRTAPAGIATNRYHSPATLVERILTATYGDIYYINGAWEEKIDLANKLYFSINNENTDPYGVSIMRSTEFCAKLLMTMQNALGNTWERYGDPSLFVKYKTTKRDLSGDDLEKRRLTIANQVGSAFRSKREGKSADFVAAVNADADMTIEVIGKDAQVLQLDIPARHVLEQIVSKTGLPAWMLGIYWSTTERMATLEVESALQDAKVRQLAMLPGLIKLFSTVLRVRGHKWNTITTDPDKPGDWGIVFETPNLRDLVAQAQARFLNAQADQMQSQSTIEITTPPAKGAKHHTGCACGCDHLPGAGKMIGTKEQRPEPWPNLDRLEEGYESRLKVDWQELRGKIITIARLTDTDIAAGMAAKTKAPGDPDAFTFSTEQRAQALTALKDFIGEYTPGEGSPVSWYYGQSYSLGLIQAARLIGKERPILDIIKNSEIFADLEKQGFDLVKNNSTKAIQNKILTEIEAHIIAGSNPMTVASRLNKLFNDQNDSWERLARTEMASAAERAKLHEWKEWKLENVEFVPAPDACPFCRSLRGDYKIEKCPIPGIGTHPRCRCSTRPAKSETVPA